MAKHHADAGGKIEEFAEDLGRLLGTAKAKAEGWLGQRQNIVKTLQTLREEATHLLVQLGHDTQAAARGRKPGRPAGTATRGPGRPKASGRKRRTMSAEARARIAAAQKARWARIRAAAGKKKKSS